MLRKKLFVAVLAAILGAAVAGPVHVAAQEVDPLHTLEFLLARLLGPVLDLLGRGVDADGLTVDPTAATGCDPIDPARCLLPFPNDFFTVADETTSTGRRISFSPVAMPRNVAGKPIDPTEWNRNDGFSPGSMILTWVPFLDLEASGVPRIWDPARSVATDAEGKPTSPIVILDAATGELHPFFGELDENQGARFSNKELEDLAGFDTPAPEIPLETPPTRDHERLLILRPLRNFEEGHRYIVAMRHLHDTGGNEIAPGPAFLAMRDAPELPVQPLTRLAHYEESIFPVLAAADVPREDLYLAWDFTVASGRNLSERILHIRDRGFAELKHNSPSVTVGKVIPDPEGATGDIARRVTGTIPVPNFLDLPGGVPGSRLNYVGTPDGNLPARNPLGDFVEANFICNVPRSVLDVTSDPENSAVVTAGLPTLYGHGLLGSAGEVNSGHARNMANQGGLVMCATDWDGMSSEDIVTVATILADLSNFPKLADRSQQGFLNFMFLGRAMIHPDGLCSHPAFQDVSGACVIDRSTEQVVYDGNSQGAIMGGSLVAVAHDVRRGVLGVPGMNYSTLLNRSVDWEDAFAFPFYVAYPDKMDQQLGFALIQMLWDRAEANGYAHHMTTDPYPDPSMADDPFHTAKTVETAKGDKQILLHVAFADHQVANISAEVEARTIGAEIIESSLEKSEHWESLPFFELPALATPTDPDDRKSAIVYWHNGNNRPPNGNVPPRELCNDPHESPRRDADAVAQKKRFLHEGVIEDTCGAAQCETEFRRNCEHGKPIPPS